MILVVELILQVFYLDWREAEDIVTLIEGEFYIDIVESSTATGQPLFVHQVASHGHAIRGRDTTYRLLSKNCYWFAGLMFDVLVKSHKLKITPADHKRHRSGKWMGVWTTYPGPATVNEIVDLSEMVVKGN